MPRERFGSFMAGNMPLSPNIGQATPNIPYSGVKPFQLQQPSSITDMPNLSNLQQIINLLMGNRPQNPLASAINGAMNGGQNTWNWQGGEQSPYGIRTPSLGYQWHYDEFGKPVPNLPTQGRRF